MKTIRTTPDVSSLIGFLSWKPALTKDQTEDILELVKGTELESVFIGLLHVNENAIGADKLIGGDDETAQAIIDSRYATENGWNNVSQRK